MFLHATTHTHLLTLLYFTSLHLQWMNENKPHINRYGILINTVNHVETKANFDIINNNTLNSTHRNTHTLSIGSWKGHKINCGLIDFGNLNYYLIKWQLGVGCCFDGSDLFVFLFRWFWYSFEQMLL